MRRHNKRLFGEVFTPKLLVKQIVEAHAPEVILDASRTVLEPAVGDGRFLTYILHQRLLKSQDIKHIIQSLSTLYGIDIQKENVLKAREELIKTVLTIAPKAFEVQVYNGIMHHIVNHNIIHGCAITKRYVENNIPIMIRKYEVASTNPIKIEVSVYLLEDVLKAGQHNSLFCNPLPLSRYVIE
jgi:type I restriction-modification system DNA methylase subunit